MNTFLILLVQIVSFTLTILIYPKLIPFLYNIKFGQSIRQEGPKSHLKKQGTPTMGGLVFLIVPLISLLCLKPTFFISKNGLLITLSFLLYGLIGFLDDYIIVVQKDNKGLAPKYKLLLQFIVAVIFYSIYVYSTKTTIYFPIIGITVDIGILYFVLIMVMFVGSSNAVNLTDGLDGLASGCMIIALTPFLYFANIQNQHDIFLFILALQSSLIGFLYYNLNPAKIFMGDSGSLALGGVLAALAMLLKQEILLLIAGLVFVIETVSVILQVLYFKKTKGKRLFKMTPIHHHFELSGFSEKKVVYGFYAFTIICAIIAILVGKPW